MKAAGQLKSLRGRYALVRYDIALRERPFLPLFGARPTGELQLGGDGRLSVIILPDDTVTDVPNALAYTGVYYVLGRDLVIQIELATLPAWRGTVQTRRISQLGNLLTLFSYQAKSSFFPHESSRGRAVWRRTSSPP